METGVGPIRLSGATADGYRWRFSWRRRNGWWRLGIWAPGSDPDSSPPTGEFSVRPSPRVDLAMTERLAGLIVQGCLAAFRVVGKRAPRLLGRRAGKWREAP